MRRKLRLGMKRRVHRSVEESRRLFRPSERTFRTMSRDGPGDRSLTLTLGRQPLLHGRRAASTHMQCTATLPNDGVALPTNQSLLAPGKRLTIIGARAERLPPFTEVSHACGRDLVALAHIIQM